MALSDQYSKTSEAYRTNASTGHICPNIKDEIVELLNTRITKYVIQLEELSLLDDEEYDSGLWENIEAIKNELCFVRNQIEEKFQ